MTGSTSVHGMSAHGPPVLLQASFPANLQLVLVLRPTGFFQRALSDLAFKFNRDDLKMKVPVSTPCPSSRVELRSGPLRHQGDSEGPAPAQQVHPSHRAAPAGAAHPPNAAQSSRILPSFILPRERPHCGGAGAS